MNNKLSIAHVWYILCRFLFRFAPQLINGIVSCIVLEFWHSFCFIVNVLGAIFVSALFTFVSSFVTLTDSASLFRISNVFSWILLLSLLFASVSNRNTSFVWYWYFLSLLYCFGKCFYICSWNCHFQHRQNNIISFHPLSTNRMMIYLTKQNSYMFVCYEV